MEKGFISGGGGGEEISESYEIQKYTQYIKRSLSNKSLKRKQKFSTKTTLKTIKNIKNDAPSPKKMVVSFVTRKIKETKVEEQRLTHKTGKLISPKSL